MKLKLSFGVLVGLLIIVHFGATAEEKTLRERADKNIKIEDNPTPFSRLDKDQTATYNELAKKAEYKELFSNRAVCWKDVTARTGAGYPWVGFQTGDTNWQPRYFCANVPNGWWDAAIKETDAKKRDEINWDAYDYFTPGAKFWLAEPNFSHWFARPMDPFLFVSKRQDAMKPYLSEVIKKFELENVPDDTITSYYRHLFTVKMIGINKQRRDVVEAKGLFWKVSVTGIGIKHQDKDGNKKESVATILKGWFHLHVTLAQHLNEGGTTEPTKIKLATGEEDKSKDYIIDRLMISARGVRLIQRSKIGRGSGVPYLIKGVTGGVGRFVSDFPGCVFKHEDHPDAHEALLFNKFVPEQELPCGSGNSFTHEVGNNFIYVRTNKSTMGKYGGNGTDMKDLHVNFRIGHPPCGHVYELDFVVVGVVVKKDITIKESYFEESLKSDPNVMYIQRSMSTRFHFIKSDTTPRFYGAPDPIPITINPKDLSCSIELKEEPPKPEDAGPDSFFGAIKKIQRLKFNDGDPFAELNDPDAEVFNPITVMYPDLYSRRDQRILLDIQLGSKTDPTEPPPMDALYFRYFKAMTLPTLDKIKAVFSSLGKTDEDALKMIKAYCSTLIKNDGTFEMREGKLAYDAHPGPGIFHILGTDNNKIPLDQLFVSPFRQLMDPLTRYPLWDFTCVGGGGGPRNIYYDKEHGQFVGICPPTTEVTVVGLQSNSHASCDFGLNGAEVAPWVEKDISETIMRLSLDSYFTAVAADYHIYIERYDATSTVREYMEESLGKSSDWQNYTLGGDLRNDLETQKKSIPGHRALNLKLCEAVTNAKEKGEASPKCLVLPPRPFTETPPPSTTPPGLKKEVIDILDPDHVLGLELEVGQSVAPDDKGSKGGDSKTGDRDKRRNKKRDKKAKRVKNESHFIPGPQKGKAIDDDLSLFEWDTRILHGIAFTLLTTFVIPVNAFLTRHFKETFMYMRIFNLRVWYFFHLTSAIAIPSIYIVGLARGLMTSGFLGHSYSAFAVWHRRLGWSSAVLSLLMVFFGWMRHMDLYINWIIVALHWLIGYLIYVLMLICTLLSIRIPGSPAAYFDATYVKFSPVNLKLEIVFLCLVAFLVFDIIMHLLLTVLQCRNDRLMLLNGPRLYLPAPIPVLPEEITYDAPGYGCRKVALIIYVCVAASATATIITVMCLYSPLDRGFGAMTCINPSNDPSVARAEYSC